MRKSVFLIIAFFTIWNGFSQKVVHGDKLNLTFFFQDSNWTKVESFTIYLKNNNTGQKYFIKHAFVNPDIPIQNAASVYGYQKGEENIDTSFIEKGVEYFANVQDAMLEQLFVKYNEELYQFFRLDDGGAEISINNLMEVKNLFAFTDTNKSKIDSTSKVFIDDWRLKIAQNSFKVPSLADCSHNQKINELLGTDSLKVPLASSRIENGAKMLERSITGLKKKLESYSNYTVKYIGHMSPSSTMPINGKNMTLYFTFYAIMKDGLEYDKLKVMSSKIGESEILFSEVTY